MTIIFLDCDPTHIEGIEAFGAGSGRPNS